MRTLEIKKIGLSSAFRFFFTAGFAGALLVGAILVLLGVPLKKLGFQLIAVTWQDSPLSIGATILGLILGCGGYGFIAGFVGMSGAWIYNCIAAHSGGIVIKVND